MNEKGQTILEEQLPYEEWKIAPVVDVMEERVTPLWTRSTSSGWRMRRNTALEATIPSAKAISWVAGVTYGHSNLD